MNTIRRTCEIILEYHSKLGHPIAHLLKPGLTDDALQSNSLRLPLHIPQSAIELFKWHNGTEQGVATFNDMWFFPGYFLVSLEEAIDIYLELRKEVPERWDSNWLPIFDSGSGDYCAIACGLMPSADGEVIVYRIGDVSTESEFSTLESMLQTISTCFENGAYSVAPTGEFDQDDSQVSKTARRLNLNIRRWRST